MNGGLRRTNVSNSTWFIKVTGRRVIKNEASFKQTFFYLKRLQIIFQLANHILKELFPTMIGINITFCILKNVGCVTLYDKKNLRIVWLGLLTLAPWFYWLICFFVQLSAMSLINTEMILFSWRERLVDDVERKQLKSLAPCGFSLGPFFKFTRTTYLDILNTILNYTTTSFLLSTSC